MSGLYSAVYGLLQLLLSRVEGPLRGGLEWLGLIGSVPTLAGCLTWFGFDTTGLSQGAAQQFLNLPYWVYFSPLCLYVGAKFLGFSDPLFKQVEEERETAILKDARSATLGQLEGKDRELRRLLTFDPADTENKWNEAETQRDIAKQVSCALRRNHFSAFASNWPPKLIASALEKGVITSAEALLLIANAKDKWTGEGRAGDAALEVFPFLDAQEKREALKLLDSSHLARLASELDPDLALLAATNVVARSDVNWRATALIPLLPRLRVEQRQSFFYLANQDATSVGSVDEEEFQDYWAWQNRQVVTLARLVPFAPQNERGQRITEILNIPEPNFPEEDLSILEGDQAEALLDLLEYAAHESQRRAIIARTSELAWQAWDNKAIGETSDLKSLLDEPTSPPKSIFSRLGPLLSESQIEAVLTRVGGLQEQTVSEGHCPETPARILIALAPSISEGLKGRALALARSLQDESARAETLAVLGCRLPQPERERVVWGAIEAILPKGDGIRIWNVLLLAAPHLQAESWRALLERVTDEPWKRFLVLASAVVSETPSGSLPFGRQQLLQQTVEALCQSGPVFKALELLVPHLNDQQIDQILETLPWEVTRRNEYDRLHTLLRWVFVLPPRGQARIWQALRQDTASWTLGKWIGQTGTRTTGELLGIMPEELRKEALEIAIEEAVGGWLSEHSTHTDECLLVEIAPYLAPERLSQLLALTLYTPDREMALLVLARLAPYLSEEVLGRVWSAASRLSSKRGIRVVLAELLPNVRQPLLGQVIDTIFDPLEDSVNLERWKDWHECRAAVEDCVPTDRLSEAEQRMVLQAVLKTAGWLCIIDTLGPRIPRHIIQDEIAGLKLRIQTRYFYGNGWGEALLAPFAAQEQREKLISRALSKSRKAAVADRSRVLSRVAPLLDQEQAAVNLNELLATVEKTARAPEARAEASQWRHAGPSYFWSPYYPKGGLLPALLALTEVLPEASLGRVYQLSLLAPEHSLRAELLLGLSKRTKEPWRTKILDEALEEISKVHEETGKKTNSEETTYRLAQLLGEMAERLPESLTGKALRVAGKLPWDQHAVVLSTLLPRLPAQQQRTIWMKMASSGASHDREKKYWHRSKLAALIPSVPPELLDHALDLIEKMDHALDRPDALCALAPKLDGEGLQRAVRMAKVIGSFRSLVVLGLRLPEKERGPVWQEVLAFLRKHDGRLWDDREQRHDLAEPLAAWAKQEPETAYEVWRKTLRSSANKDQGVFLADLWMLLPMAFHLGGPAAGPAIAAVAGDVYSEK